MLRRLLKRLRKVKAYRKLSLSEKVQVQQSKVNLALGAFADAYQEVETAQVELNKVIKDGNDELAKLQRTLDTAIAEHEMNEKVKVKLAEFIPGKD